MVFFFFFKQKTAYEMSVSDWSSDVCSSDLGEGGREGTATRRRLRYPDEISSGCKTGRDSKTTAPIRVEANVLQSRREPLLPRLRVLPELRATRQSGRPVPTGTLWAHERSIRRQARRGKERGRRPGRRSG